MLIQQGQLDEAEASLRAAIDLARAQKAKSWQLRSATTLARLLAGRGDTSSARESLSNTYSWFTEGFDTEGSQGSESLIDVL